MWLFDTLAILVEMFCFKLLHTALRYQLRTKQNTVGGNFAEISSHY
jgi:hypothetical protein